MAYWVLRRASPRRLQVRRLALQSLADTNTWSQLKCHNFHKIGRRQNWHQQGKRARTGAASTSPGVRSQGRLASTRDQYTLFACLEIYQPTSNEQVHRYFNAHNFIDDSRQLCSVTSKGTKSCGFAISMSPLSKPRTD